MNDKRRMPEHWRHKNEAGDMRYNFRTSGTEKTWSVEGHNCLFRCKEGISYISSQEIVLDKEYKTEVRDGILRLVKR